MQAIPTGRYRHYKGKEYEVIGLARHSETEEEFVVYRTLYGNFDLWVRPKAMFLEMIQVNGESVARFQYLGPMESSDQSSVSSEQLHADTWDIDH
jgi:hypothetical protein